MSRASSGTGRPEANRPAQMLYILGMHRSGTALLASCAAETGLRLPRDIQPGAPDNPRGHFEPLAVVALNDAMLADLGTGWDRIGPAPPEAAALARTRAGEMRGALTQAFGRRGGGVMKDPRLSLLLPLWRPVVAARGCDERCLIALRRPGEVAASLARRDGIDPLQARLAWLSHTLGALSQSTGMPRELVLFPDWTADPADLADRLERLTGCTAGPSLAERIAARIVRGLVSPPEAAAGPRHAIENLTDDVFARLASHAAAGTWPDDTVLAAIAAEAAGIARPAHVVEARAAWRQAALAGTARARRLSEDAARARAAERLAAAEASAAAGAAACAALAQQADGLRERLAAAERECEGAAALASGLAQAQAELAAVRSERSELLSKTAALTADLARSDAQRGEALASLCAQHWQTVEARACLGACRAALAESEARRAAEAVQARIAAGMAEARNQAIAERLARTESDLDGRGRQLLETELLLRSERMTVLKPAYRNLYSTAGLALRRVLPARQVERLKRLVPHPDQPPARLTAVPPSPFRAGVPAATVSVRPADPHGPEDIFIFAIIAWDFRTQRPQHLAREFAARGHRVFYVEMQDASGGMTLREVADGVFAVQLGTDGIGLVRPYSGMPRADQAAAWIDRLEEFCDGIGATPIRHVVVEHPFWWAFLRHLPAEYRITVDCMDEIAGFSNTLPHILAAEAEMTGAADRIVVSSAYLARKHGAVRAVSLVRNGADARLFPRSGETAPRPGFLPPADREGRMQVGYVGAIAEWFDCDLLRGTAMAVPTADFHLCGSVSTAEARALGDLPNVRLHGEIPYRDVPGFIAAMDVMTIPFRLTPIIEACDPVKFYEHAAAMKPTVATPLPELDRAGGLVFRAGTPAAFADALHAARRAGRRPEHRAALRAYAEENSWSARAEAFIAHMTAAPRVSVIVLSWGKADFTLAALHSLVGAGRIYPDLEVIVVDNGSAPDELDRLRAAASAHPGVVLIENGENLGFARGNNIGIARGTGEYVLLLNNDTFVAPGAIHAMVAHLEQAPGVGVVGPLTNAIGNEARVEVAYSDMAGMVRAARRVTRGYRGMRTELPVLAYFCAMFRRTDLARFGPIPEDYGLGMFEDDDHCARIRQAGLTCALAEDAFVHHHLSASFDGLGAGARRALFERNRAVFEAKWGAWRPHRYRDRRPQGTLEAA